MSFVNTTTKNDRFVYVKKKCDLCTVIATKKQDNLFNNND